MQGDAPHEAAATAPTTTQDKRAVFVGAQFLDNLVSDPVQTRSGFNFDLRLSDTGFGQPALGLAVEIIDAAGIPIGRPSPGRVLVPVDGSSSSLRAIDHLAFILAGRKDVRLTLFHVQPKLRHFCPIDFDDDTATLLEDVVAAGDTRCIDNFYGLAQRKLAEAGIDEAQIEIKTRTGLNRVGNQIVKELGAEEYGTLVLGRSGGSRSHFMGSVALHVVSKATSCAVWVVP